MIFGSKTRDSTAANCPGQMLSEMNLSFRV